VKLKERQVKKLILTTLSVTFLICSAPVNVNANDALTLEQSINEAMKIYDKNNDGKITRSEFDIVTLEMNPQLANLGEQASQFTDVLFKKMDTNRDGIITKLELGRFIAKNQKKTKP
jgi:Ca2+-binding EF-hand superfamily protein